MSTLWTFSYEKRYYTCNSNRSTVPPNLAKTGVLATKWAKIVDACNNELLPAIKASDEYDAKLATQMQNFTGNQMVKGAFGFGMESSHEKKTLQMIHQAAVLNNNQSLLTYKIVTMANALLNSKHNVMVQPMFTKADINNFSIKTTGLTFILMDE